MEDTKKEVMSLKQPVDSNVWDGLNNAQLWYIYLGLSNLSIPEIKVGTNHLARTIKRYGIKRKGWVA